MAVEALVAVSLITVFVQEIGNLPRVLYRSGRGVARLLGQGIYALLSCSNLDAQDTNTHTHIHTNTEADANIHKSKAAEDRDGDGDRNGRPTSS